MGMRLFRIYCSIVLGVGFTSLIAASVNVTWILGITLLMPGLVANWLASFLKLPETYAVMLVGDALLYSALAAIPVYFITLRIEANRTRLVRSAGLLTAVTVALVLTG